MEPVSGTMAAEVAVGLVGAIIKSRQHLQDLVDAVRGANNANTVWFKMNKELADYCELLLPLFDRLEAEAKRGRHGRDRDSLKDLMRVLSTALRDGLDLVAVCQSASPATLFFRGETMREKFRKVAERIARCLQSIPLAAFGSALEMEHDVHSIAKSLETARFELSDKDKALFHEMHEAVSNQGVQSQAQHAAMLDMFRQMEARLKMQVSDMRQELQVNLGDGAVDLEAKEQKFLDQIAKLLAQTTVEAAQSSASPPDAGASKGKAAARQHKFGHPEHYLCPITLELMLDPVMDANGHTFERRAITMALLHRPGVSPKTNKPYLNGEARLLPNYSTKHAIEAYREEHGIDLEDLESVGSDVEEKAAGPASAAVEIQEEEEALPAVEAQYSQAAAPAQHHGTSSGAALAVQAVKDHLDDHGFDPIRPDGVGGAIQQKAAGPASVVVEIQEAKYLPAAAAQASQAAAPVNPYAASSGAVLGAPAQAPSFAPASDAGVEIHMKDSERKSSGSTRRRMLLVGMVVAALAAIAAAAAGVAVALGGGGSGGGADPPPAPPPSSLVRTLDDPTSYVYGIAYAPDGDTRRGCRHLARTRRRRHPRRRLRRRQGVQVGSRHGRAAHASHRPQLRLCVGGGLLRRQPPAGERRRGRHGARVRPEHRRVHPHPLRAQRLCTWALAFAPDDEILVSGSSDNTAKVWAVATGELLTTLTDHTDWVRGLAFAPDGRTLATASFDSTVKLWRTEDWTLLRTLSGHSTWVQAVAYSPDGAVLATGSSDDTVRLWDPETGTTLHTIAHSDRVLAVAFSPDGAFLATGSADRSVRVWSALDGWSEVITLNGHSSNVNGLAFAPGGRHLASSSYDGTVKIWQVPA